jgi:hypothetical protein
MATDTQQREQSSIVAVHAKAIEQGQVEGKPLKVIGLNASGT